ncbi:MAG: FixH family protein [Pseudomonadota bacterium]
MTRRFTGRHMLALTVSFFAVVIAVNLVMATFAARTFGGTVVDNSYVASQQFNRWLDEAHAQRAMGWRLTADRVGSYAYVRLDGAPGASVEAAAIHPLGVLPGRTLHFVPLRSGVYRSIEPLPAGRWRLEVKVRQGGHQAHFVDEVPA